MRSIRARLLLWLGAGLMLLFGVAGFVVYGAVRDRVENDFIDDLREKADTLAAGLELEIEPDMRAEAVRLGALLMPDPNRDPAERERAKQRLLKLAEKAFVVRFTLDPSALPAYVPGPDATYFSVARGRAPTEIPLASSELGTPLDEKGTQRSYMEYDDRTPVFGVELDGAPAVGYMLAVPDVPFRDPAKAQTWRTIRGADERFMRPAVVRVIRAREGLDRLLGRLRAGLLIAGLVLLGLIALVCWWVVNRGLAPVHSLSEQVGRLDAQSLDQRIDAEGLPQELTPIATRLNEALGRIAVGVDRERRTAAHIAHELRTPVAELMSITEIAKRWGDDAELQSRAVGDSHEIALHMSRVVTALLKVARAGTGPDALELASLDIAPIVRKAWDGLASAAAERQQELDDGLPEALEARTDADVVEAVIASLLKNAIQHAPPSSRIRVGTRLGERAQLQISNPAPDLGPEDVAHVSEAFWRKDDARTSSDEGGLGLTLAFELCRSAGIDVDAALRDGHFVLTLAFPA